MFLDAVDARAATAIVEHLQASTAPMAVAQLRALGDDLRHGRPATPMSGHSDESLPAAGFKLEEHLQDIEKRHLERARPRRRAGHRGSAGVGARRALGAFRHAREGREN